MTRSPLSPRTPCTWHRSLSIVLVTALVGTLAATAPALADHPVSAGTAVFRVNAGGAAVSGSPAWTADTTAAPSTYVNAAATTNKTATFAGTIDLTDPSIPAGTPAGLFSQERWDPPGGAEMLWSFPVTAGAAYEVNMFFADTHAPTQVVGGRVFDITVEGNLAFDNFDIFATVGANKAIRRSVTVTPSDTTLTVELGHVTENPEIRAIEITQLTTDPTLGVSPSSVTFPSTVVGNSSSQSVTVTNQAASGGSSLTISGVSFSGANASQFSTTFSTPVSIPPGGTVGLPITFAPTSVGAKTATLAITHTGANSPTSVPLTGSGTSSSPGTPQHRVNAGGPAITGSPSWAQDTAASSSPYVNAAATTNKIASNTATLDMSHPSIPAGVPASLFATERWDPSGGAEMQWSFPVTPGTMTVRLYFAETYAPTQSVGSRVFNVSVEGTPVLNNYDIFADVGANKAVMKSFTVASNSTLNIDFAHVTENPAIKAIEIIPTNAVNQLGATPSPLDFGSAVVGATSSRSLTLSNLGSGGDPSITVSSASISGTNASSFSVSFSSPVTLAPGASTTVPVMFNPASLGAKAANLSFAHSGSNPLSVELSGTGVSSIPIGFGKSMLSGSSSSYPTSLQFGPDGRLYVGQFNGLVKAYTVGRTAANAYGVTATETINLIQQIPNHNDNGALNTTVTTRLITGLLVTGTAASPVVYVTSSDPRIGGGSSGTDTNLDTNSSMLSRLTKSGASWTRLDLVRGLPRSEENHSSNGMSLDAATNTLYIAHGGNTNKGAPSNNFALLPEFALSAAILSVNLDAIGNTTYDLPTLDDDSRAGTVDAGDPFGGNNGKNQARLVPGSPVQIHAPGFRNPYDVLLTSTGRMYSIDNGGNAGWGSFPVNEGPGGTCTNQVNEPGTSDPDALHFITGAGYYGGHPNPTRGSMANTFNADAQSPVSTANPVECDYRAPGTNGSLTTFPASTNGLTEYTTNNFGGAMKGNLLAAGYSANGVYRIVLNAAGTAAVSNTLLFTAVGAAPLDVVALDASAPFPGTVWVVDQGNSSIYIFEPNDFEGGGASCSGADDATLDEDGDGFDNHDEILNGTSPCSAADMPPDNDGDKASDLLDPDDDNDGLPDTSDYFAVDAANGTNTSVPVRYTWDNGAPPAGGLLNLGFTGLMTNGTSNYQALFDPSKMTAGGAGGLTTVDEAGDGDALGATNTQTYGLQFGVKAPTTGTFTAHTALVAPFSGITPTGDQSFGMFIGTGTQDDYIKIVATAGNGTPGLQVVREVGGAPTAGPITPLAMPGPGAIDLYLTIDVAASTVQPWITTTTSGVKSAPSNVGSPLPVPSSWLTSATSGLATGIISTSAGPAPTYPATWDFIEVVSGTGLPASASPVFRVNAGGAAVSGSPAWTADTTAAPSTYVNAAATTNKTATFAGTIDLTDPSIPAGTPAGLFSQERWDPPGGAEMLWSFPVTAGAAYEVNMFFADTHAPTQVVGGRVFDITVEGNLAFDNFDIFATVGANKAIRRSVTVTPSDTTLTVELGHVTENPEIRAIEITQLTTDPTLGVSPSSVTFPSTVVGNSSSQSVTVTNQAASGGSSLTISGVSFSGANASQFSTTFSTPVSIPPGGTVGLPITFAPTSVGAKTATLAITHTGANSPTSVPLTGSGTSSSPGTPQHRVNAGGPAITGSPSWAQDTAASSSPYVNAAATTNKIASNTATLDMSHPSIPAGVPASLFATERWDPSGGAEMQWSFPVTPGTMTVRLYFAETYAPTQSVGSRVFNVSVEGTPVLNNYDIFADVGANKAVMKSFTVASNSTLNIDFAHVTENPAIKAIEIIPADPGPQLAGQWTAKAPLPTARSEVGVAAAGGRVYSVGGKSDSVGVISAVTAYDPSTNSWANVAALPGPARDHVGVVTVNDKIYAVGGLTSWPGPAVNLLYEYNPATNAWTQKANVPTAIGAAGVAAVGTKIYVMGGLSGSTAANSALVYDTVTNVWSSLPNMPTSRDHLIAEAIGSRIYAIGGRSTSINSILNTNEYFDIESGTWGSAAPMPTARGGIGSAVLNGRIYVFGGEGNSADPSGIFAVHEEFDAASNTWRAVAPMATPRHGTGGAVIGTTMYAPGGGTTQSAHDSASMDAFDLSLLGQWGSRPSMPDSRREGGVVAANGDVFVLGGNTGSNIRTNTVLRFSVATSTWSYVAPYPGPALDHTGALAASDGTIYLIGGTTNVPSPNVSTLYKYNVATDTWASLASLPTTRAGMGVASVDGKIYVVGGWIDGARTNTTLVYDPVANSWSSLAPMPTARDHVKAVAIAGKIYAVGGFVGAYPSATTGNVEVYDPTTNTWSTAASLPTPRADLGAVVLNGRLITFGGVNAGGTVSVVEAFDPVQNSWQTLAPMLSNRRAMDGAVINGVIYAAGGSATLNDPSLSSFEAFSL